LVSPRELSLLKTVQQKTKANLIKGTIPTSAEVVSHKMKAASEQLLSSKRNLSATLKETFKATAEFQSMNDLTKEELIFKFLASKVDAVTEQEVPFDFLNGRVPREMDPNFSAGKSRDRHRERSTAIHFAKERFDRNGKTETRGPKTERSESRGEFRSERADRGGEDRPRNRFGGARPPYGAQKDRSSAPPRKMRTFND
jgi:hypothetical protein